MSRDYKAPVREQRRGGSLLAGIFIGLFLGLVIATGVAWYLNSRPSPFLDRPASSVVQPRSMVPESSKPSQEAQTSAPANTAEEKPRFDFYQILPSGEQSDRPPKKTAREPESSKTEAPVTKPEVPASKPEVALAKPELSPSKSREALYLQAGAFQKQSDADNLKARLALMGLEAKVASATLPDNQVWHRVRLGPYTRAEEAERVRSVLKQNGINGSLIRVREGGTPAHN
jgi:cell division protein FtsN